MAKSQESLPGYKPEDTVRPGKTHDGLETRVSHLALGCASFGFRHKGLPGSRKDCHALCESNGTWGGSLVLTRQMYSENSKAAVCVPSTTMLALCHALAAVSASTTKSFDWTHLLPTASTILNGGILFAFDLLHENIFAVDLAVRGIHVRVKRRDHGRNARPDLDRGTAEPGRPSRGFRLPARGRGLGVVTVNSALVECLLGGQPRGGIGHDGELDV